MNKLYNLNGNLALLILLLFGCLMTTHAHARSLYKSIDAKGKVTYSNHPTAQSQSSENISLLKASPKFSVTPKQNVRSSSKS
ncbi:MAG: DUF4124 domain-containing protein [Methylococcaceae bacterium]|nr:DUF4124 domain-containing protein [Methylococcaceae bacterium]